MIIIKEDYEKFLDYVHLRINLWVFLFLKIVALNSVCTTVTWITEWKLQKFVDLVWSTVFQKNRVWHFATSKSIAKADCPLNFTIFHCRMRTIQPTWPVCTTSECWHTRCWHFCSCSSYKTIPSLREWAVTQTWSGRCYVTHLSISITQIFIMIAMIGYKVK